ncbi:rod-binding protein [Sphingobium sp. H39-3-25]|nr:rod-binding protein [Sphingobium arseniciresistens]
MSDVKTVSSIPQPAVRQPDPRVAKTARDFEAVFAGQITKLMMESVEVGDDFSGGHAEEMFRGVLAEQMGNEIARGKGLGISSAVQAQMMRMQGGNGDAQ